MLPFDDERLGDLLRRSLTALDAYRDDLVLIGGLVPLLYRFLPDYSDPGIRPCATMDVDLSVETVLPIRQERGVRQALEQAGLYVFEVPGIGRRGGQQYYQLDPNARLQAEHLEFLAPLRGPDSDEPTRPQPGLMAQALRFIDLLRAKPIRCEIPGVGTVLLPHPCRSQRLSAASRPASVELEARWRSASGRKPMALRSSARSSSWMGQRGFQL